MLKWARGQVLKRERGQVGAGVGVRDGPLTHAANKAAVTRHWIPIPAVRTALRKLTSMSKVDTSAISSPIWRRSPVLSTVYVKIEAGGRYRTRTCDPLRVKQVL